MTSACVRNWRQATQVIGRSLAGAAVGCRAAHVGEHDVLEADLLDRPGRVDDRLLGAHEQRALAVGVGLLDHLLARRQPCAVAPRPAQPAVGGEQLVDLAAELDATLGDQDQVVADALEVGDEVRGRARR